MDKDYQPYSKEWEAEMMKLTKKELINTMLKPALKKNDELDIQCRIFVAFNEINKGDDALLNSARILLRRLNEIL